MTLRLPIEIVGGGDGKEVHAGKAFGGRGMPNLHDAGGVRVGKGTEKNSIDDESMRPVDR